MIGMSEMAFDGLIVGRSSTLISLLESLYETEGIDG